MGSGLTWNIADDVHQMLHYHFMVNALITGTAVAVVAGSVGYLMVLRRQSFAGHTLAIIGFPGAAGATWLGMSAAVGYYGFCIAAAIAVALLPARGDAGLGSQRDESAVIGTVQAVALGAGFLFVSLYKGFLSGLNNLLFGTITGVTDSQVRLLLAAAAVCLLLLLALGRPLLFTSIDPAVATARGVPGRAVGIAFLLLLGIAAAGTSQVTGSLLVFALLVAPAATAVRLTARPAAGIAVAVLLALVVTWVGETIAFFSPYPIGFWVSTLAFAGYVIASVWRAAADRARPRQRRHPVVTGAA